ncbi:MAG: hypothetical protein LBD48_08665 [Treponema sp.]|nr:hypothetical protein [Treponema sp.]
MIGCTVILPAVLCTLGCQVEAAGNSGNGTVTINGLSQYDGQFALFATDENVKIDGKEAWVLGASSFTTDGDITGRVISNGTVILPAWAMPEDINRYRPERLDGNDTPEFQYAMVYINVQQVNTDMDWWHSPVQLLVSRVAFANGSASIDQWTVYAGEDGALFLPHKQGGRRSVSRFD